MRLWIIVCCAGIGAVTLLTVLPEPVWLLPLVVCFTASLKYKPLKLFGALSFGCIWGVIYGWVGLSQILPYQYQNIDLRVQGEVVDLPFVSNTGGRRARQRFIFKVNSLQTPDGESVEKNVKKIRVSWYQIDKLVKPGEHWQLTVRLKRPKGMANPGAFDYETYLFRQGIGATGYVRKDGDNMMLAGPGWSGLVHQLRYRIIQQLSLLEAHYHYPQVLQALIVGDRSAMDEELWQRVTRTGTNHLFVISGLHVGLIALFFYSIVMVISRWFLLGAPRIASQQLASLAALAGSTFYSALAGFSLPTQRALIMLLVMMMGKICKRQIDVVDSFLLALFAVLIWDPLAVRAIGFWLSFGAVAVLIAGFKGYTGAPGYWWRWGRPQWLVFLVFIPALLFFFGQFSLVSPLANSFAIPLVGLLAVPLCLAGGALLFIANGLGSNVLVLADQIIWLTFKGLAFLEQWSFALIEISPSPLSLIVGTIGVLLLILPRGLPGRCLAVLMIIPLFFEHQTGLDKGSYNLTVFDVGQGLSVMVETAQHRLIYDVGPSYSKKFNTATAVLLPYIKKNNIEYVDRILLSHSDNDHAGAFTALTANLAYGDLTSGSEPPVSSLERAFPCSSGYRWSWDGVNFQLMQATEDAWRNENNRSCVLKVDNGSFVTLLTGDIEKEAEQSLITQFSNQLKADLLIAPHHGSRTSSSPDFIKRVMPQTVVFTAGYLNRFGHPKPDVVDRYRSLGAETINTVDSGAASFVIENQGLTEQRFFREQQRGYWY